MTEEQREELWEQLDIIVATRGFLALLVLSICLSVWGLSRQWEAVCQLLRGEEAENVDLFPQKVVSNAIAVGALVYFFLLTLNGWRQSAGAEVTTAAKDSARWNLWAALLALAAALIRLWDLIHLWEERQEG